MKVASVKAESVWISASTNLKVVVRGTEKGQVTYVYKDGTESRLPVRMFLGYFERLS